MLLPVLALIAALAAPPAAAAKAEPCSVRLKTTEDARDLYKVKLEEEVERADAQTYLTRLELRVTQQKLTAALAKCGAACAPALTPPVR